VFDLKELSELVARVDILLGDAASSSEISAGF
jgi:hypothetical protein